MGSSDGKAPVVSIPSEPPRPQLSDSSDDEAAGVPIPSKPPVVVRKEDRNKHAGQKRCASMSTETGVALKKGGRVGGPKDQRVGCSR